MDPPIDSQLPPALVLVEDRPVAGRVVEVRDGLTLGRARCDVRLVDPRASRLHAVLRIGAGGRPAVEDLGSRHGTWVNGRRIDGSFGLRAGDVVQLGQTVWRVERR